MPDPGLLKRVPPPGGGYSHAARTGTGWATTQVLLNKIATTLAMVLVAHALDPAEYGLASLVNTASGFVMVLPVLVMGDVLISHQRHLASVVLPAWRVAAGAGALLTALMLVTAPLIAWSYDQYDFVLLSSLLAVCALRPIAETLSFLPLTRMRLALRYREIAIANGTTRLGATVLTVFWALALPGAAAIVVPQVLMTVSRAFWYALVGGRPVPIRHHVQDLETRRPAHAGRARRRMARDFSIASFGQYVHTFVSGLAFIVSSRFLTKQEIGEFGLAVTLAPQAISLFAIQVGVVLQPIFGRLRSDRARQAAAYVRTMRVMAALTVPLALVQAALAEPLFKLLFAEKWFAAVPIFVALTFGQTTIFVLAPTMALLKAQGRFATYLIWQLAHAAVCIAVFPWVVESYGAPGAAWTDALLWSCSLLVAVGLAVRGSLPSFRGVVTGLILPWLIAGPLALGVWFAWRIMPGPTPVAAVISIFVVGPVAMLLAILSTRITQPSVAAELAPLLCRVLRPVPIIGPPLASWFASAAPASANDRTDRP